MATWLFSNTFGSGHPHIICPILKYISISKNTNDDTSLLANNGVVVSLSDSSSPDITELPPLPLDALLPLSFADAP